jgi:hypothetical protein
MNDAGSKEATFRSLATGIWSRVKIPAVTARLDRGAPVGRWTTDPPGVHWVGAAGYPNLMLRSGGSRWGPRKSSDRADHRENGQYGER